MGFFATFWRWLDVQLALYVNDNTARMAAALEPAIVTFGTIYVMVWGYLQMTGRVEEPFAAGLKRIVTLAVVLGVCLHLWLYGDVIVDTFYRAPARLAAAVIGATDPIDTVDRIWERGGGVAGLLWNQGRWYNVSNMGFWMTAWAVWAAVGLLCVYAMYLIALAAIMQAVLLAMGPLFFALLLFEATREFFNRWLSQLAVYGFVTILTVLVSALLLRIVDSYAAQVLARGSALQALDALNLILVSVLVFMLLRQVMSIASGLGGGFAVGTGGIVGGVVRWGMNPVRQLGRHGAVLGMRGVGKTAAWTVRGTWRSGREVVQSGIGALRGRRSGGGYAH